jgi:hypothetical protein
VKYLTTALYLSPLFLVVYGAIGHPLGFAASAFMVVFIATALKLELLPIVQKKHLKDANGRNSILYVQMDPDAPMYKAVLAQEIYECLYKVNPINLIRSRTTKGQREMELMGHEVEVQAAVMLYGVKEAQYRRAEASAMQGWYECFKGMELPEIVDGMMDKTNAAQSWVAKNQTRFA